MTVTKTDLVKSVMERVRFRTKRNKGQQYLFPELDFTPLTKKRATELVDTVFGIMKKRLEKGENVLLTGFGKFQVKFKWARKGRNPQTGREIVLDSRRIVTFKCSNKLREKVNEESDAAPE